jgi:hypothetical protein
MSNAMIARLLMVVILTSNARAILAGKTVSRTMKQFGVISAAGQGGRKRRRAGSFGALYLGLGLFSVSICLNLLGTVLCEDVGPF